MLATFIVVWRESLEATLVVVILLAYLRRIGQAGKYRYIYLGVIAALAACVVFARVSAYLEGLFEGAGEEIFQASIIVLAVVVVTTMVIWMHRQAGTLRASLEGQAALAIEHGQVLSLALLAALAVFREGCETVLFLWGLAMSSGALTGEMLGAGAAGAAAAVAMGYLLFLGAARINLKMFFEVTAAALLIIAAGMLAEAANKLIGVGMLPPIVGQVWNSAWLLDERGPLGSIAAMLFGYRSRPSLMEVAVYIMYFPPVLFLMWHTSNSKRVSGRVQTR